VPGVRQDNSALSGHERANVPQPAKSVSVPGSAAWLAELAGVRKVAAIAVLGACIMFSGCASTVIKDANGITRFRSQGDGVIEYHGADGSSLVATINHSVPTVAGGNASAVVTDSVGRGIVGGIIGLKSVGTRCLRWAADLWRRFRPGRPRIRAGPTKEGSRNDPAQNRVHLSLVLTGSGSLTTATAISTRSPELGYLCPCGLGPIWPASRACSGRCCPRTASTRLPL